MLKLLLDMNLSPKLAPELTAAGYECVHWSAPDADDREIVEHAKASRDVIITNDLDFGAILAETGLDFPSIMLLRHSNLSIPFLLPRIINTLRKCENDLIEGALLVVDERRIRTRSLPLR